MASMAKLVVCSGCGGQVSDAAPACPRCGQPAPKKGVGAGSLLLVLAVLFGSIVYCTKKVDEFGSLNGARVSPDMRDPPQVARPAPATPAATDGPPIDVTAAELHAAYAENEVSADEKYRGKILRVTGILDAIKKDITDAPYVVLRSENRFEGVHASFAGDALSTLTALKPGKPITLRCIGDNVIIGNPKLKGCVIE